MNEEPSFENALLELEKAVRDLEDGRLGLEDSLARYEHGISLIKLCYKQLSHAEQRILQLAGNDEEGKPILQPFKHEATAIRQARTPKSSGPGSA